MAEGAETLTVRLRTRRGFGVAIKVLALLAVVLPERATDWLANFIIGRGIKVEAADA